MPPRKRKQAASVVATPPLPSSSGGLQPAKLKVAELRLELETRGLDTGGKKAELVARLEAALGGEGPTPGKKAKEEEEELSQEESHFKKALKALKQSEGGVKKVAKKKARQGKVDSHVPGAGMFTVEGDWDCMLNQTNIGQNNNKFYVIQMLNRAGRLHVWTRWGRVGEPGQNAMKGPFPMDAAEKEFCKKFKDKTKNDWESRGTFTPVPGKYTLIEMDDDDEDEGEVRSKLAALDETDAPPKTVKPCQLDKPTQNLLKLIFDNDMFNDAMKSMEIDTKKMPLGKLSKTQIAKGFEALEAIEDAINSHAARSQLAELSSRFYTIIPHAFGRQVPPVLSDHETLQKKFDMLLVLGDIEIAQGLKKEEEKREREISGDEVPHPLDLNYELLKAGLSHLDKRGDEFGVIQTYLKSTEPQWRKIEIQDVWAVDREGESDLFRKHEGLKNRRLLWHGTNVAVVAAILKTGLRIMPHSGGRVGRGIYFASECSKSAGYVRCTNNIGIMFLNEVALGEEHHITMDDCTITTPPKGFHSVIAKGRTEPDPNRDIAVTLDGHEVVVPQGNPIHVPKFSASRFSQSEYLVYQESQARIRYLLKLHFQH